MAELTLTQLLGQGAIQTSGSLIIQKSSLLGLTISASNRPEQLLGAIVFNAKQQFVGTVTSELGTPITSESGAVLTYDNSDYYETFNIEQWQTVVDADKRISTFLVSTFTQE